MEVYAHSSQSKVRKWKCVSVFCLAESFHMMVLCMFIIDLEVKHIKASSLSFSSYSSSIIGSMDEVSNLFSPSFSVSFQMSSRT
jgi:hypothetical protein